MKRCSRNWRDLISRSLKIAYMPYLKKRNDGRLISRRAHLLTISSEQAMYPSLSRKRQSSLTTLFLLFPTKSRTLRGPLGKAVSHVRGVRSAKQSQVKKNKKAVTDISSSANDLYVRSRLYSRYRVRQTESDFRRLEQRERKTERDTIARGETAKNVVKFTKNYVTTAKNKPKYLNFP